MKTLKLGALALGMMVAGSVMAMDAQKKALYDQVSKLYTGILHAGNLLTPEQQTNLDSVPVATDALMQNDEASAIDGLKELRSILEGYTYDVKHKQAGKLGKMHLATASFITTHPRKLAVVAAAAVIAVGVAVYKKLAAKKKKKIEVEETEDNIKESTAE